MTAHFTLSYTLCFYIYFFWGEGGYGTDGGGVWEGVNGEAHI